ncbi:MAG TPA: PAS domain-containing sensor histidine kinase [Candidatus Saccharimonadia bacterium]|nr:PAS domain-containing sensor histidine kinase [Candidatus Saccharimonadia bacterium]
MAGERRNTDETSFRRLMDKAPDAIIIYNSDNSFYYVNPATIKLFGYKRQEIMDRKVSDFIRPGEKRRLEAVKERRKQGDKSLIEWQVVRKDGSYIEIEASTSFLEDRQQWISFLRDITERKRMEERIRLAAVKEQALETKAQMLEEQSQSLLALNNAKDEFIKLASHQLRTPATSVKQYVGMLLGGYFGKVTPKQRAMLKTAYDANERQMSIVNNLLLTAELETGQAQALRYGYDLVQCIKELAADLAPGLSEREQTLVVKLPRSCKAFCDVNLLKIALGHIINNASQYSQKGKSIAVQLIRKGNYAIITVKDQGVGIRRQDREQLYRKFTRIPNALTDTVNGNGLGLYLTKQIIDLHEGEISLSSRINRGSAFTLRVPLKAPVPIKAAAA